MFTKAGVPEGFSATEISDSDALTSPSNLLVTRPTSKKENKKVKKRPVALDGAKATDVLPGALSVTAEGVIEQGERLDDGEAGMNVRDTPKLVNDSPSRTNSAGSSRRTLLVDTDAGKAAAGAAEASWTNDNDASELVDPAMNSTIADSTPSQPQ